MTTIAAIVLTYNEERHLPDCLASLAWCDEIWVVDSHSTDGTLEIARRHTDRIVQIPSSDFSTLRETARTINGLTAEWILFLDADERITPELAEEIPRRLATEGHIYDAFYIPGRQHFWGKWLKHGEASPYYQMKLLRREAVHFDGREVHEDAIVKGKIGVTTHRMIHIAQESMIESLDKLNRYTTLEALRMYRTGEELYPTERRSYSRLNNVLKRIFSWIPVPFRPFANFFLDYVFRQGFRDGHIGLTWAIIRAIYVWVSYFKAWELRTGRVTPEELKDQLWRSKRRIQTSGIPTKDPADPDSVIKKTD